METAFGIPQGSLLRTLLFNIFIADLFFDISDTVIVPLFGGCHSFYGDYVFTVITVITVITFYLR